jgi:hypothetical protein
MPTVKVFKSTKAFDSEYKLWKPLVRYLADNEFMPHLTATDEPYDVSVVLGGRYENPMVIRGRKVLFYKIWDGENERMVFQTVYLPVLKQFYDETVDISRMSNKEILRKIKSYEM